MYLIKIFIYIRSMIFFVLLDLICCLFAHLLYISHWNAKLLLQWKEEKVIIILLLENEGKKRLKERRSTEKSELSILWLYRARTDLLGEILLAAPAISFWLFKIKEAKRKKETNKWMNERTNETKPSYWIRKIRKNSLYLWTIVVKIFGQRIQFDTC